MLYYWVAFALLAVLVVFDVHKAFWIYMRSKNASVLVLHTTLLLILVILVMHSVIKVFTVMDVKFHGFTGLE